MTKLTTDYCKGLLSGRKKDISDVPSDLFLTWLNELQETVYPYLYNNQDKYQLQLEINVVSWTQTYTIPKWILEPLGTGVFRWTIDDLSDIDYYDDYTIITDWTELKLKEMPTDNMTLTYVYVPALTEITDFTEDTIFDISMKKLVTEWLDELYSTWDEDWFSESNASQRFIRELDKLPTMDNADLPILNNY